MQPGKRRFVAAMHKENVVVGLFLCCENILTIVKLFYMFLNVGTFAIFL